MGFAIGEKRMAEQSGYEVGQSAPMDYREHKRTYSGFLWLVKYGTAGVIAILLFMLMFLIVGAGVIMSLVGVVVFLVLVHFLVLKTDEMSMTH